MKRIFINGIVLFILQFTGLVGFGQEAVDFKINPEIGQPLTFDVVMKTDMDGAQSLIMNMNMNLELTPTKKENENISMESSIKGIKVDIFAGMMNMSYDSEVESTDATTQLLEAQFSKILNQTISAVVSSKGQTIDMSLPDDLAMAGLDVNSFSNVAPSLPENPVLPGDSWEGTSEVKGSPEMAFRVTTKSTYREETPEGYVIDLAGTMFDAEGKEMGTLSGNYVLDKNTHFTKSSNMKTSMDMDDMKIISEVVMNVNQETN